MPLPHIPTATHVPQPQLSLPAEWITAAGKVTLGYLAYKKFYIEDHYTSAVVNLEIQKDNPKVEHAFKMEDLGDMARY